MANVNAGVPIRFENGGIILIGALTLLNIKEGSMKWDLMGYDAIPHLDRGVLIDVLPGNERPCTLSVAVKYTSLTDADGILPAVMGPLVSGKIKNRTAAGKIFTFPVTVKVFNTPDGATYDQLVFNKCYLPNGLGCQAAAGQEHDTLTLDCTDFELSPDITNA